MGRKGCEKEASLRHVLGLEGGVADLSWGGSGRLSRMGVSTMPGRRAVKRTPSTCSSKPAACANSVIPALEAW